MEKDNDNIIQQTKKTIVDLYTNSSLKILTRGKIKRETLDKIMEDINANCKKKS